MRWADHWAAAWVVGVVAFAVAAVGARPYAGCWNDGSRLAAVESLVARGTLAIDDSIYVKPPELQEQSRTPYPPGNPANDTGTRDRLLIGGHFYSDKPAVISALMAGAYRALMWAGAPPPSENPGVFAFSMTLLTSGLAYAVAAGCLWAIGRRVGLAPQLRLLWLGAFLFGTLALAYTRYVNNHAMHLGVVAAVCALLARTAATGGVSAATALGLGTLAGIGFNLDFGSGPLLVATLGLYLIWRERRLTPVLAYTLGALPWVVAGAWLNYAVGGVLKPMNMVPEYSDWPGGPFTAANLTGFVRYGPLDQARYLLFMLVGAPGFVTHNLPLWLLVAFGWGALRKPFAGRAELLTVIAWCAATWLLYGFLSNNYAGKCLSIRWFVPFLAPGFWLLAVVLRDRPTARPQFAALCAWGALLGALMWWAGPWTLRAVPLLAPIAACALVTWAVVARLTAKPARVEQAADETPEPIRRAA